MSLIKRFFSMMPVWFQNELKKFYYMWQIKNETFVSSEPEFEQLNNFINEGGWAIDIGANIGHYTNKLSSIVGTTGRVIAFEPIPITFAHLSKNMSYGKYKNITLINAAASKEAAVVGMSIPDFSSGLKNYYQASILSESKVTDTSVLTLSIDSLQIDHKINLIKIDAEGYEPVVFLGMEKLLKRDRPILIVETVTDVIREQLTKLGYVEKQYENSPNTVFMVFS